MKVEVFNQKAAKVGEMELNDTVFGRELNRALIHQVIVAQLANMRQGTKSTLTRSEVRGGGIKPWRQKGTGRARQGSIRSPQWTGGGVVFAPKPRDFSQKINKKMKRAAMMSVLSGKAADKELTIVDAFAPDAKTKNLAAMLAAFGVKGKCLLVLDTCEEEKAAHAAVLRAAANIPGVKVTTADLLSVYDAAAHSKCLLSSNAVKKLEEKYAK